MLTAGFSRPQPTCDPMLVAGELLRTVSGGLTALVLARYQPECGIRGVFHPKRRRVMRTD
jgi:hypothetical protein